MLQKTLSCQKKGERIGKIVQRSRLHQILTLEVGQNLTLSSKEVPRSYRRPDYLNWMFGQAFLQDLLLGFYWYYFFLKLGSPFFIHLPSWRYKDYKECCLYFYLFLCHLINKVLPTIEQSLEKYSKLDKLCNLIIVSWFHVLLVISKFLCAFKLHG